MPRPSREAGTVASHMATVRQAPWPAIVLSASLVPAGQRQPRVQRSVCKGLRPAAGLAYARRHVSHMMCGMQVAHGVHAAQALRCPVPTHPLCYQEQAAANQAALAASQAALARQAGRAGGAARGARAAHPSKQLLWGISGA